MSQDCITLRQDLPVEFDHGDVVGRVEFEDSGLFDLGKLLEGVTDVFVGYAGILRRVC